MKDSQPRHVKLAEVGEGEGCEKSQEGGIYGIKGTQAHLTRRITQKREEEEKR